MVYDGNDEAVKDLTQEALNSAQQKGVAKPKRASALTRKTSRNKRIEDRVSKTESLESLV